MFAVITPPNVAYTIHDVIYEKSCYHGNKDVVVPVTKVPPPASVVKLDSNLQAVTKNVHGNKPVCNDNDLTVNCILNSGIDDISINPM